MVQQGNMHTYFHISHDKYTILLYYICYIFVVILFAYGKFLSTPDSSCSRLI
jgi:hypothetical protein